MASSVEAKRREDVVSLRGAAGRDGSGSASDPTSTDRRFPRSCRLRSRREFVAVYSKGHRVGSSSFTIFGLSNNLGQCRVGLTVSRKVGGAVTRNRVKRTLREIFRLRRSELPSDLDLVVNAYPSIKSKSFHELDAEFVHVVSRLARRARS